MLRYVIIGALVGGIVGMGVVIMVRLFKRKEK
jgi:LPS O-antigen subunit length determinant protein (WzzB/FepE family)